MWRQIFHGFGVLHFVLLAFAAIGFFKFWGRTRFWLPKYVHVLAAIGLAVSLWVASSAPEDAPMNQDGPLTRLLMILALPAMVYFFFIFHGGQHAAFVRSRATHGPCPFCQKPVRALPPDGEEWTEMTRFVETECPHCNHAL